MLEKLKIILAIVLSVAILPLVLYLGYELYLSMDSWYYTNYEKPNFLNNQHDTIWETGDGAFSLEVLSSEKIDGDGKEPIVGTYTYENGTVEIAMYMSSNGDTGTWNEYGVYAEEMYNYMVENEHMDLLSKPYGDEGALANVLVEYESNDKVVITVTRAFRDIFEKGDTFTFYRVDNVPQTE